MNIREIQSKSVLSKSEVYDYVVNPYVGCQHACSYCYARFMKRFTGHREPWGEFVDAKINAPEVLAKEVLRKPRGTVWLSGVCDPYQPLEGKYRLTRACLGILVESGWPVVIQTRSPLVLRDLDLLKRGATLEAGFSIGTSDDEVRKAFEPLAPPIEERLRALGELRRGGVRTYAMIAPILPGAEELVERLADRVDRVIVDRMNYGYASEVYRRHAWEDKRTDAYFAQAESEIARQCRARGVPCELAH
jgi:DNA repair photolyase